VASRAKRGDVPHRANILLMSATVTPRDSPELARTDPNLRLADYATALAFYIPKLGSDLDGIVFVENSDSDISSLRDLAARLGAADRVEFIANYGVCSFPGRDRSYGEFKILERAMQTSRLIANAGEEGTVWKITGRYIVANLHQMLRSAPRHFDLYCDLRERPIKWADLRFLGWSRRGFERLLDHVADTLGEDPREPAMYHHIRSHAHDSDLRVVTRYRREPLIEGVRGWDNRHYSRGAAYLKYLVRATARRVAPFVHI
jgi:hypothetical protein